MNEEIKTVFNFNGFVLKKNLEDITHEESLKSPDAGGNCINWIVGHIIVTRDSLNEELGMERLCDDRITELYVQGSKPISHDNAEDLSNLLKLFNESQEKLMKAFNEKNLKDEIEKSKSAAGFGFHEAYHVGQLGILRRVIGKAGAIT